MSRSEIKKKFEEIVDFSGVERFLDTPLKRYSTGMYLRLAFAVAAHVEPDVVIVDEVLAVGDAEFQRRCLGRMSEFGREGRTVLFVSHDSGVVAQLCGRALWLERGTVKDDGPASEVLDRYYRAFAQGAGRVDVSLEEHSALDQLSLTVLGEDGEPVDSPRRDRTLIFDLAFRTRLPLRAIDASIFLIDHHGTRIVNENLSYVTETISGPPDTYRIRVMMPPVLTAGDYTVGVWLGNNDELVFRGEILRPSVLPLPEDGDQSLYGTVRPSVRWSVERGPDVRDETA